MCRAPKPHRMLLFLEQNHVFFGGIHATGVDISTVGTAPLSAGTSDPRGQLGISRWDPAR